MKTRIRSLLVGLAVCACVGLSPLGVAALPTPIPQASQTPPPDVATIEPTGKFLYCGNQRAVDWSSSSVMATTCS